MAGVALRNRDIPADLPERNRLYPETEEWINPGDSVGIAPGGELVAGPSHERQDIFYAEIDPERAAMTRRTFDVAGHYARRDLFTLQKSAHITRRLLEKTAGDSIASISGTDAPSLNAMLNENSSIGTCPGSINPKPS